jgi:hypothetical protein
MPAKTQIVWQGKKLNLTLCGSCEFFLIMSQKLSQFLPVPVPVLPPKAWVLGAFLSSNPEQQEDMTTSAPTYLWSYLCGNQVQNIKATMVEPFLASNSSLDTTTYTTQLLSNSGIGIFVIQKMPT